MNVDEEMTMGTLLAAFDEHLRRVRSVCPGTRRNYARYVAEFLITVFADGAADPRQIRPSDVAAFVAGAQLVTGPGRWSRRRHRCVRSSGSCARRDCVRIVWRMRFRWCRGAKQALSSTWIPRRSND